jgi:hypothetical protein
VLGVTWDKADNLAVGNLRMVKAEVITRRTMLSLTQWVFDLIGFTCPISRGSKLLLQHCWITKGKWDQEFTEDVRTSLSLRLQDFPLLEEVKIPRWLMGILDRVIYQGSQISSFYKERV